MKEKNTSLTQLRLCMTPSDMEALDYLTESYCHNRKIHSLRYAIMQQVGRDAGTVPCSAKLKRRTAQLAESVNLRFKSSRNRRNGKLKQWSNWFTDEDCRLLEKIVRKWKLKNTVSAVRLAVRVQAEIDGCVPAGGVW